MRTMKSGIRQLCLIAFVLAWLSAWAEDAVEGQPEVRALLFYAPDSAQYEDLFSFFLPGLLERYGERLEISAIDASRPDGAVAYQASAARLGLPPQWDGTPVVLVGDRPMVGLMEIAGMLGDDFEGVATIPGAARWTSLPELTPLLADGARDLERRVASDAAPVVVDDAEQVSQAGARFADILALAVLVAMALILILSLLRLWRRDLNPGPAARLALVAALLVGLGISGYTAYSALSDIEPMCGPAAGCGDVQESEYAKLFGIPMGVLGLIGYASILIAWLMARRLSPHGGGWRWLPWGIALFAVLFSLRLTALGYFVIGASCIWCLGSALSISVVLWLLSGDTRAPENPSPA